jgi:hypothetical protein
MQSDCPAAFFLLAIEHNDRLGFGGKPGRDRHYKK